MKDPSLFDIWYVDHGYITDDLKKVVKDFKDKGFNVLSVSGKDFDEKHMELFPGPGRFPDPLEFADIGYGAFYVPIKGEIAETLLGLIEGYGNACYNEGSSGESPQRLEHRLKKNLIFLKIEKRLKQLEG